MKKLIVLLAVVCFTSGAFATSYNMTSGWESSNWSYGSKVETGYSTGVFGAFTPAVNADLDPGNVWLERWGDLSTYQLTGAYQTWVGMSRVDIWIPLNKVTAQPWVVTAAVARFSGAEAGTYDLSAVFKGVGPGTSPVGNRIIYIQKNGGTIWSSALVGYDTVSAAQQVTLGSGDYLDFIVTDAHNYSNGQATMDATLTLSSIQLPQPPDSISYPTYSTTGQYTVSWSSVSGATSYQLERSSNGGGIWSQVYSGPNTSYPESISSGSYRYRVKTPESGDWRTGTSDCLVDTSSFVDKLGLSPYVWKCTGADATFRAEATMPGAYLKTVFQGTTTVGLSIDGTANTGCPASSMPVIEYSIDNNPFTIVQLTTTGSVYTLPLASGLSSGAQHTLELYFRAADMSQNRWTASTAHLRIAGAGLALDSGGVLVLRSKRPALAIGFGDSITEGVGVDGLFTSWQILTPNNARGTWFPMVCSALNCEYGQLGTGGQGMVNPALAVPPLPQTWDKYDSTSSRLTGGLLLPEPNYVFCEMGTNDSSIASQPFKDAYTAWLITARQACPNARIFCVTSPFGDGWHSADVWAVVAARNQAGDAKVYLMDVASLVPGFKPTSGGPSLLTYDGGHPSLYGHSLLGSLITAEARKVISAEERPADINNDGTVDFLDLATFASKWLL